MAIRRSLQVVFMLLALVSCGGDSTTPEVSPPSIAVVSGDGQSATAGEALGTPVSVRVSQDGSSVSGVNVSWAVTAGDGSVNPATSVTNSDGIAATVWTLGASAGANTLQASASSATGSPVVFSATGTAAAPPMLASVSVDNNFFDPSSTTIAAGGSITWTWVGGVDHNVTFPSGPNSSTQAAGTFERTFADVGSFDYLCTIHGAAMSGTVVVQ